MKVYDIIGGHDGTTYELSVPRAIGLGGPVSIVGNYVGNSLQFDVGIYAKVPHAQALNFGTDDFTIDAWIKYQQSEISGGVIVAKADNSSGYFLRIVTPYTGNQRILQLRMGGGKVYNGPAVTAPPGTWIFVAATRSGNNVTLYVDGLSQTATSTGSVPSASSNQPLFIAAAGSKKSRLAIDELEIFNRALRPDEIEAIYAAGRAGKCCKNDDVVIDLSTGVIGPIPTPALIAPGSSDDTWSVTCVPPGLFNPIEPIVVDLTLNTPSSPPWGPDHWLPIPPSQWISTRVDGNYHGIKGQTCYRSCFCLNDGFQLPSFTFSMRAAAEADLYLNGQYITSTPQCQFTSPPCFPVSSLPCCSFNSGQETTGLVNLPEFFQPGENCVEVLVRWPQANGRATGFTLHGQVTAQDAECCCRVRSDGLGCTETFCSEANGRCESTVVSYSGGKGEAAPVRLCRCLPPNSCRVIVGPDGPSCSPSEAQCALQGNDTDGDNVADEFSCIQATVPIPSVSEWGLVILTLLLLVGGKVYFARGGRSAATEWV